MIQTLFPNNDAVFQDDSAPIHTAGTVQPWFEEHEGELQHLPWPVLNIIELLSSVLETGARNRPPTPTSPKQLDDVLQEEWHRIPLETVRNLYESILRRTAAVMKVWIYFIHVLHLRAYSS
jgi:hypothetical protein